MLAQSSHSDGFDAVKRVHHGACAAPLRWRCCSVATITAPRHGFTSTTMNQRPRVVSLHRRGARVMRGRVVNAEAGAWWTSVYVSRRGKTAPVPARLGIVNFVTAVDAKQIEGKCFASSSPQACMLRHRDFSSFFSAWLRSLSRAHAGLSGRSTRTHPRRMRRSRQRRMRELPLPPRDIATRHFRRCCCGLCGRELLHSAVAGERSRQGWTCSPATRSGRARSGRCRGRQGSEGQGAAATPVGSRTKA